MSPRWDKAVGVRGRLGRRQVFLSVCTCVPAGVHGCVVQNWACIKTGVHRGLCAPGRVQRLVSKAGSAAGS